MKWPHPEDAEIVYFMYNPQRKTVKIGKTKHLKTRFAQIKNQGGLCDLELIDWCYIPKYYGKEDVENKCWLEKAFHHRFHYLRTTGEWFQYTDKIKEFLTENIIDHNVDMPYANGLGKNYSDYLQCV